MKKFYAACGLALALAACSSEPVAPLTAGQALAPKIAIDVKVISLADRTGMLPPDSLYATNKFSPTITEGVKQWATDRLQAVGQTGQAIILVKKASLIAQPLPLKDGMSTWFTRQQAQKYIGEVEVAIEATGRTGFATTEATAIRMVSVPEDATAEERQNAYAVLLEGLMRDLGTNLETGIRTHMQNFVTSSPVFGATAVPVGQPAAAAPGVDPAKPVALTPEEAK